MPSDKNDLLNKQNSSSVSRDRSIKAAADQIAEKQTHGKLRQLFESREDRDHVMECYQQIEAAFRYLQVRIHDLDVTHCLMTSQMDAGLWALRKLNRLHEVRT